MAARHFLHGAVPDQLLLPAAPVCCKARGRIFHVLNFPRHCSALLPAACLWSAAAPPGDAATGAILTPYKGQVRCLEYGLRVLAPYFAGMEVSVSSVDGYQGREADVIVFTAVR